MEERMLLGAPEGRWREAPPLLFPATGEWPADWRLEGFSSVGSDRVGEWLARTGAAGAATHLDAAAGGYDFLLDEGWDGLDGGAGWGDFYFSPTAGEVAAARAALALARAEAVRRPRLAPVLVLPIGRGGGRLAAAAGLAREWAAGPLSPERIEGALEGWRRGLVGLDEGAEIFAAWRDGELAGLLCGRIGRLWPDGGRTAFAPLAWARGRDCRGRPVGTAARDAATTGLVRAFLAWGRAHGATGARVVFRPGLAPGAAGLAALGLRPVFDVCIRHAILPEDGISRPGTGRVSSDDVAHWRAEGELRGDPDWVEKRIRERYGWAPLRGRFAPRAARALSAADADAALALLREARGTAGVDAEAFAEWFAGMARGRGKGRGDGGERFVLGADARLAPGSEVKAAGLAGLLGGWTERHPFLPDCGLAVGVVTATTGGGKDGRAPRRVQDSLALGLLARGRRIRATCLVLPPGAEWADFRERWRFQLAGNGYGVDFAGDAGEDAGAGAATGEAA